MTLYNKYRPHSLHEITGQPRTVKVLEKTLDDPSHAYLFAGPRGVGKTSLARIIAKTVNCLDETSQPCGLCQNCVDLLMGRFYDLIELDAASNRGIDTIRNLLTGVQIAGAPSTKYKIYIIDEVHMLTREASNALLKSLEEPPKHVIFILATTDPRKIISTIRSRCQTYKLDLISTNDITDRLIYICKEEGWTGTRKAAWLIAETARGSLRDALTILEQVAAYCDGKLQEPQVIEYLRRRPQEDYDQLLTTLKTKSPKDIINTLNSFDPNDVEPENVMTGLSLAAKHAYMKTVKQGRIEDIQKLSSALDILADTAHKMATYPAIPGRLLVDACCLKLHLLYKEKAAPEETA